MTAATELKITTRLIDAALAHELLVSVNDGENTTVSRSADRAEIIKAMCSTEQDQITLWTSPVDRIGTIYLIYGNGAEVISDYSEPSVSGIISKLVEIAQGDAPIARTIAIAKVYRLGSGNMIGAPGLVAWAINGAKFKRDRETMINVVAATWNIPEDAARALVSGDAHYTVENDAVVFTA